MNFNELSISNPKRLKHQASAWSEFFPYYAGYSDTFAMQLLRSSKLRAGSIILDPWNGSGTTTFAATQLGYAAIGFDLNPVMVIVARSRLLQASEADSLLPITAEILRRAQDFPVECSADDPLRLWFTVGTASWLRSIEGSIRAILIGELTLTSGGVRLDRISSLAATFYVALFNLAKELASAFQSSNPTWLRKPRDDEAKVSARRASVTNQFIAKIRGMASVLQDRVDLFSRNALSANTYLADSTSPLSTRDRVDFVLTSPPYCTRIDYTSATRIQLAVLQPFMDQSIDALSRLMVGSIKVPKASAAVRDRWGARCISFLESVRLHPSYASSGYYLKTHIDYFDKMDRSLENMARWLRRGGGAVLVVQDSHYKEIHNDVPAIISDIAKSHRLALRREERFDVKTSMSGINSRSRIYRTSARTVESVLCFEKI